MTLNLSCPSKTFLLGEYLVLNDGPAFILNTNPRFQLRLNISGEGSVEGFSPECPAGQWVRQNKIYFQNADIEFIDPHLGRGGFGASSAQYLLTCLATLVLKGKNNLKTGSPEELDKVIRGVQIEAIWRAYRQLEMVSAEGLRPSGADIVGQFLGGMCEFKAEPFEAQSYRWPFTDMDFVLTHTGRKIATHEHLRGLQRLNTDELACIYARAKETLAVRDAGAFFDSINDYYAELLEMGLVAETTQVAVASLLAQPYVRAAKGCGAMGSDVVAIFVAKESRPQLDRMLPDLGLKLIADSSQLATGYALQVEQSDLAPEQTT